MLINHPQLIRILSAFLVFCGNFVCLAQSNQSISGSVLDAETRSAVSGATVYLDQSPYQTTTDFAGEFTFENLPEGIHLLVVEMLGFEAERLKPLRISSGSSEKIVIQLQPRPIALDSILVISVQPGHVVSAAGETMILDSTEIEQFAGMGIDRVLMQIPGLQVDASSGGRSQATLRMHGGRSSQVLVLLDGQRLNDPQTGNVDLNEINLDQIGRIEVIRHGSSAMHGGGAFDGVVMLFSRASTGLKSATLSGDAGAFSTAAGAASISLQVLGLSARFEYNQDYSKQDYDYIYEDVTWQRENAWYRNRYFFALLDHRSNVLHTRLRYSVRKGSNGIPSAFYEEIAQNGASGAATNQALQLSQKWIAAPGISIDWRLGYRQLDQVFDNQAALSPFTRYHTQQGNTISEGELSGEFNRGRSLLIRTAVSRMQESMNQQNLLFPQASIGLRRRTTTAASVAAEYRLQENLPALYLVQLNGALRYESSLNREAKPYPLFSAALTPENVRNLTLSAGWGQAVRYPDFNSLFWKGDARASGNPELLPEQKEFRTISLHVDGGGRNLPSLSILFYNEHNRNLIYWHRTVNGAWEPRNEDSARKEGWDIHLEQSAFSERIQFRLGYSRLDARNGSDQPNLENRWIVFTPRHTLHASLWNEWFNNRILLNFRAVSERQVVQANTQLPLEAYQVLDISFNRRFKLAGTLIDSGVSIKNLTAEPFELIRGYPMPSREYLLQLKLSREL